MAPNYEQALYFLAEADLLIIKLMGQLAQEHPPANFENDPNFPVILELITEGAAWCDALRVTSGVEPLVNEDVIMEALLVSMLSDILN